MDKSSQRSAYERPIVRIVRIEIEERLMACLKTFVIGGGCVRAQYS